VRKLIYLGLAVLLSTALFASETDYTGGGFFKGNGSRGFSKSDPNYEEYDTAGFTYKLGAIKDEHSSGEISVGIMDTKTVLNNHVIFIGFDVDYIATLHKRQSHFINPFISIGLGSYYFTGDTDNNNTTYDETEGVAFNAKVGLYLKISRHIEIEAHMHGKSFLWNGSENDTSGEARRAADSMTNFYLGLNWHI